jgi:hypothetical protein
MQNQLPNRRYKKECGTIADSLVVEIDSVKVLDGRTAIATFA